MKRVPLYEQGISPSKAASATPPGIATSIKATCGPHDVMPGTVSRHCHAMAKPFYPPCLTSFIAKRSGCPKRIANHKNHDARVEDDKLVLTRSGKDRASSGHPRRPRRSRELVSSDGPARSVDGGQSLDALCAGFDPSDQPSSTLRRE